MKVLLFNVTMGTLKSNVVQDSLLKGLRLLIRKEIIKIMNHSTASVKKT